MSLVTFKPQNNTPYRDGWPERVEGDGFILLRLRETYKRSAVYGRGDGEWAVEVRDDG